MPTPRETNVWKGVELDVEKRRHVKEPFLESFVTVVATPFDALLAQERPLWGEENGERRQHEGQLPTLTNDADYAALEQEISARSHQVHLRLEILRHQLQSLTHDSLAVLDTEIQHAHTVKDPVNGKSKGAAVTKTRSERNISTTQELHDRMSLYESGELAGEEMIKGLGVCGRCKDGEDDACAQARMLKIQERLEHDASIRHKMALSASGPSLENIGESTVEGAPADMTTNFLKQCKRLIRPFFLEDFVKMRDDDQANCNLSLGTSQDASNEVVSHDSVVIGSNSDHRHDEVGDNGLALQPQDREHEVTSTAFCIRMIRNKRRAVYQDARVRDPNGRRASRRDHRLQHPLLSAENFAERTGYGASTKPLPLLKLLANPRAWKDMSMSLLDPSVNLLELRHDVRPETIGYAPSVALHISTNSTGVSAFDYNQPTQPTTISKDVESRSSDDSLRSLNIPVQQKRPLGITQVGSTKRQCVKSQSKGPIPLRAMMITIRGFLSRVAETTCVSYFRTLAQNSLPEENPRRVFVALVFTASLANAASATNSNERQVPITVSLHATRQQNDVKIVTGCHQR